MRGSRLVRVSVTGRINLDLKLTFYLSLRDEMFAEALSEVSCNSDVESEDFKESLFHVLELLVAVLMKRQKSGHQVPILLNPLSMR